MPDHLVSVASIDREDASRAGLATGADEYVTKPFKVEEAIARVGAMV